MTATGFRNIIARVSDGDAVWIDAILDRVADILAMTHGHDHNRDELRSTARTPETLARLAALIPRQLAALRPQAVIHVHLTDEALRTRSGIARVEDLGPLLVEHLNQLLAHADIRLQPLRDLNHRIRLDQYEHPDALKDHTWHLAGGDGFPYAPHAHRAVVDYDHPTPYDQHGPPGQTGNHNSAPLRRTHHRWKTLGGYRCRQASPGPSTRTTASSSSTHHPTSTSTPVR